MYFWCIFVPHWFPMDLVTKARSRLPSEQGNVELDLGRYELHRAGRRVKLEKKPMELLIFLVRQREQLVSRQEIVAKLWQSDLFIDTERNINNIVRKIRRALGDHAAKPRIARPAKKSYAHRHETGLPGSRKTSRPSNRPIPAGLLGRTATP